MQDLFKLHREFLFASEREARQVLGRETFEGMVAVYERNLRALAAYRPHLDNDEALALTLHLLRATSTNEHLAAYAGALELCPFDVFVQAVMARVPPGSRAHRIPRATSPGSGTAISAQPRYLTQNATLSDGSRTANVDLCSTPSGRRQPPRRRLRRTHQRAARTSALAAQRETTARRVSGIGPSRQTCFWITAGTPGRA